MENMAHNITHNTGTLCIAWRHSTTQEQSIGMQDTINEHSDTIGMQSTTLTAIVGTLNVNKI